jgi:hypothetical protein
MRNTTPSSSGSNKLRKIPAWKQVACLQMEAICSSEKLVDFQRTTRRYIPEDNTLYSNRCENLKSYFSVEAGSTYIHIHLVHTYIHTYTEVDQTGGLCTTTFSVLLQILLYFNPSTPLYFEESLRFCL